MRLLVLDPFSGISGDMLLGALLDLGAPAGVVRSGLARLKLPSWSWTVRNVRRGAFRGTRVEIRRNVRVPRRRTDRNGLLARVIRDAGATGLPRDVAAKGVAILQSLLRAEARVHGHSVRHAHLHEVEDLDTVVDVFGALLALRALGVGRVYALPAVTGGGTVRAAHGELPVPAPGTAELLRGRVVRLGTGTEELVTPTGAALLAGLAAAEDAPPFRVERVGYGAGARDGGIRPNLFRAFLGTPAGDRTADAVYQLEAAVDDMSPQLVEAFLDRAYREGALEAWSSPLTMKHGRPGFALTALTLAERLDAVAGAFLEETGTLGVRILRTERLRLGRRVTQVRTRYGPVSVKLAGAGASFHVVPEWQDVVRCAHRAGVPPRLVLEEARAAAGRLASP